MNKSWAARRGFTLVEIMIVITVIAILAAITAVAYKGMQQRGVQTAMINDLSHASSFMENYALKNKGEFPDANTLAQNLTTSQGVHLSVTLKPINKTAVYMNLTPTQKGVLFDKICNDLLDEYRPDAPDLHYGQGRDRDGKVTNFVWGPNFCNVYNANELTLQSSWGPRPTLKTPVNNTALPNFVAGINHTDSYFPDRNTVEKQFYQTWHERFLAAGGVYPVTTFWNPSYGCNAWSCWNLPPYQPLPDPVTITADADQGYGSTRYCILATSEAYPNKLFSLSSDVLEPRSGNCDS